MQTNKKQNANEQKQIQMNKQTINKPEVNE